MNSASRKKGFRQELDFGPRKGGREEQIIRTNRNESRIRIRRNDSRGNVHCRRGDTTRDLPKCRDLRSTIAIITKDNSSRGNKTWKEESSNSTRDIVVSLRFKRYHVYCAIIVHLIQSRYRANFYRLQYRYDNDRLVWNQGITSFDLIDETI